MRIAVIGGGIAGISAAHGLEGSAEVVLFESRQRLGGHADTHNLLIDGQAYAIDSGFAAFNRRSYPGFSAWLDALDVSTQPASMSFSVSAGSAGLEYGTADFSALFSQRRNIISPRFLLMLADIRRFCRSARRFIRQLPQAVHHAGSELSLGAYLERERFSTAFVEDHLLPICAALWSTPADKVRDMPYAHVAAYMAVHQILQNNDSPGWEVCRVVPTAMSRPLFRVFRVNSGWARTSRTCTGRPTTSG